MKNLVCITAIILALLFPFGLNSAYAAGFGIETFVLTIHVDESAIQCGEDYPNKLDDKGRFVYMPGLELYWEWDLKEESFLNADGYRFSIAGYSDSMERFSGYIHLGLRFEFPFDDRRILSLGLGPSLFFRETWRVFPNYTGNQFLIESDTFLPGYEHMWIIFGDVDFQYKISKDLKLVCSILPVLPFSVPISLGVLWEY